MYSVNPSSNNSTRYFVLPPRINRALTFFCFILSFKKRRKARFIPPAPACNENPSFNIPAASIKFATCSAISNLSGDFVTWVVPETIFAGSPSESTSTT